jgi:hypothetical protein
MSWFVVIEGLIVGEEGNGKLQTRIMKQCRNEQDQIFASKTHSLPTLPLIRWHRLQRHLDQTRFRGKLF